MGIIGKSLAKRGAVGVSSAPALTPVEQAAGRGCAVLLALLIGGIGVAALLAQLAVQQAQRITALEAERDRWECRAEALRAIANAAGALLPVASIPLRELDSWYAELARQTERLKAAFQAYKAAADPTPVSGSEPVD